MKYDFSIKDIGEIAAQSVGIPGWRWIRWQKIDVGGSLVTGYVPQTYKRGPKRGTRSTCSPSSRWKSSPWVSLGISPTAEPKAGAIQYGSKRLQATKRFSPGIVPSGISKPSFFRGSCRSRKTPCPPGATLA